MARERKEPAQGDTASWWQSQDWNSSKNLWIGTQVLESMLQCIHKIWSDMSQENSIMNISLVKVLEFASARQIYTWELFHREFSKPVLLRNFFFFQEWAHGKSFENCCLGPACDFNRAWTLYLEDGGWWTFLIPDDPKSGWQSGHLLTRQRPSLYECTRTIYPFHIIQNMRKENLIEFGGSPFGVVTGAF